MKEFPINALEQDAIYSRKIHCYLVNNHKLVKFVKRAINKRARKKAKNETQRYFN